MINFLCPGCNASMKVKDERAGAKMICPTCKTLLVVPSPAFIDDLVDEVAALDADSVAEAVAARPAHGEAVIEIHDGVQRAGYLHFDCGRCGVKVRAARCEMGLDGWCPGCGTPLHVPRMVKLEPFQNSAFRGGRYLTCPGCQARIGIREEERGDVGPCPRCGKLVIVPERAAASSAKDKPQPASNAGEVDFGAVILMVLKAVGFVFLWPFYLISHGVGELNKCPACGKSHAAVKDGDLPGGRDLMRTRYHCKFCSHIWSKTRRRASLSDLPSGSPRETICDVCGGRGWLLPGTPSEQRCPCCGGQGVLRCSSGIGRKQYSESRCELCGGRGWLLPGTPSEQRCPCCGGQGVERRPG